MATRHYASGFNCLTCHNPHKRVIWDGDGITKTCATRHSDKASTINHAAGVTCIDCHMPFAAKSGTTRGASGYKGDVRSHLMSITADTASMFVLDGSAVRDDSERSASLSPAYSCLGCHNDDPGDGIPDKTLEQAVPNQPDSRRFTGMEEVTPEPAFPRDITSLKFPPETHLLLRKSF